MHPIRPTLLAALLALAAAPAMAQSTDRSWRGDALRYTPSTIAACNVALMEAATGNGHVIVTLRQNGNAAVNHTLSGELAGNGQRSIASVATRLEPGRNTRVTMMRVYPGSLANSVLTLSGTTCSPAP